MEEYGVYHITISSFHDTIKPELLHTSNNSDECIAVAYQKAYDYFQTHSEYSHNWGIIPLKSKWVIYNLYSQDVEIFYACRKDSGKNAGIRH